MRTDTERLEWVLERLLEVPTGRATMMELGLLEEASTMGGIVTRDLLRVAIDRRIEGVPGG